MSQPDIVPERGFPAQSQGEEEAASSVTEPTLVADERPSWGKSLRQVVTLLGVGVLIVAAIWVIGGSEFGLGGDQLASGGADLQSAKPEIGHPAPDFALKDLEGNTVGLSSLKGKTVVINFWASWCPPCRAEAPDLEALHQENRERGVVVLAVNVREDEEAARRFASSVGLTMPILLDSDSVATNLYETTYLPSTFFIDHQGIIREMHLGAMSRSTMDWKLEKARQGQ